MALLPILRYPDPRLHQVARPVAMVDDRIYGRVTPERLREILAHWRQA